MFWRKQEKKEEIINTVVYDDVILDGKKADVEVVFTDGSFTTIKLYTYADQYVSTYQNTVIHPPYVIKIENIFSKYSVDHMNGRDVNIMNDYISPTSSIRGTVKSMKIVSIEDYKIPFRQARIETKILREI